MLMPLDPELLLVPLDVPLDVPLLDELLLDPPVDDELPLADELLPLLPDEPLVVEREDKSLLIAGALPADALSDRLGIDLPEDREFATAAGYVLWVLKRLPKEGEYFHDQGWRFEVVDMDGLKIDKLLVSMLTEAGEP